jgi:hypothetical protein
VFRKWSSWCIQTVSSFYCYFSYAPRLVFRKHTKVKVAIQVIAFVFVCFYSQPASLVCQVDRQVDTDVPGETMVAKRKAQNIRAVAWSKRQKTGTDPKSWRPRVYFRRSAASVLRKLDCQAPLAWMLAALMHWHIVIHIFFLWGPNKVR